MEPIFEWIIVELLGVGLDAYFWGKSLPNRRDRRAALRTGAPLPPKTNWTRAFIVLTIAVMVGAALLLWNWSAK